MNHNTFLSTVVVLMLGTSLNAQKQTDLQKSKLNGKIKKIEQSCYEVTEKAGIFDKGKLKYVKNFGYNVNGYCTEYLEFNSSTTLDYGIKFTFDGNNNCLTETDAKTKDITGTFKYDANNNIIEKKLYYKGQLSETNTYTYDDKGRQIKIEIINYDFESESESNYQYTYNEKNQLINEEEHAEWRNSKTTNTYDKDNNLIESTYCKNKKCTKRIWKFDQKGNVIEASEFDETGVCSSKYTYKFDKSNNVIEEILYNSDGSIKYIDTVGYEYDKQNNWITMKDIFIDYPAKTLNPSRSTITTRKISY